MHDPTNGGYVHAPSLTQARTAAVLRSGYLANATTANPQTLAVNLSSDRVRLALSLLEGIRNGQSLGALLGYRFERGLHDDHATVEVDKFIYPAAQGISAGRRSARADQDAAQCADRGDRGAQRPRRAQAPGADRLERRHDLSVRPERHAAASRRQRRRGAGDHRPGERRCATSTTRLSDLALAEGVHQAVQGNFDRIGATLDAYSTGNFPPEPQVVETPPAGIGLTHRVAVHLRTRVLRHRRARRRARKPSRRSTTGSRACCRRSTRSAAW